MKILARVDFSVVLETFDKDHAVNMGTNNWARETLQKANQRFAGEWHTVQLSRKEALHRIELVWHHDPRSGLELIPEQGLTVAEVVEKFSKMRKDYAGKNRNCYEKIIGFGNAEFNAVFLSTEPIKGFGIAEYEKLQHTEGNLVHLDGLHRLVAWAAGQKFRWWRYNLSTKKLCAFVAGPIGPDELQHETTP